MWCVAARACAPRSPHARPTLAPRGTILRRARDFNRHHALAGPRCLAGEDGAKACPARVADVLAKASAPHQVGDPPVFGVDAVVLGYQGERGERGLVVEVPAL